MLQITPLLMVYGGLALGAVALSAFARREDRAAAFRCATTLFAAWLLHLSSWTLWSPEKLLTRLGMPMAHIDAWALTNMLVGAVVLLLACIWRMTWWGAVLFGLILSACFNDVLFWLGLIDWQAFSRTADFTFMAEESVFLAVGGPHAVARIGRIGSVWRRHLDSSKAARAKASVRRRG